jgi:hypothetical protein
MGRGGEDGRNKKGRGVSKEQRVKDENAVNGTEIMES